MEEGRQRGLAAARQHLEESRATGQREAEAIRALGESEAREVVESASESMETLIEEMVRIVLAPPKEPGK